MEVHAHHYSAIASRMNQMKCFTGDKIVRLCSLFFCGDTNYIYMILLFFMQLYMRLSCTGCPSCGFLLLFHRSDSVKVLSISSMIFFDWKFEWKYVYTKVIFHISVYETLLRILNKLFENSYWVDDGYSFENFATSTITYVRKLIM